MREIDRRTFIATSGLALAGLAAGCSKKKKTPQSLDEILKGVSAKSTRVQMIQAVNEVPIGSSARIAFALIGQDQTTRYTGGSAKVYVSRETDKPPVKGPYEAVYHGDGLGEKGVYVAHVNFDAVGVWVAFATGKPANSPTDVFGVVSFQAVGAVTGPAPGAKAVSVPSPTVDDHRGVEPYCTRTPACGMHRISLDVALANGKPTVLNIGTPRFCTSRVCGPVVDVVETVAREFPSRINFVHVEVYKDDKDAPAKQLLSPAAKAWSLETEPITYWIKPDGTIVERIVGPVDVAEVRALSLALIA